MALSQVLLLNGPNLNLLGEREPDHYGATGLEAIEQSLAAHAATHDIKLSGFQSNAEHELVERIHKTRGDKTDLALFNPGAFTHTSVALRDALLGTKLAFYEVHLSNTYAREPFRHKSYFSDIAEGVIVGCGPLGYRLALDAAIARWQEN